MFVKNYMFFLNNPKNFIRNIVLEVLGVKPKAPVKAGKE